ncbi:ssk1 response regulator receiver [Curvularia kusanoi]|uniref:Ssk1 response regulator receiver n=1 Tax=Curvularia kusanoi TaxID=90978 RepID=A0A9P4TPK3_CURKU|nr:ssk1 response regulator receiver [Curvularia kusanoi]
MSSIKSSRRFHLPKFWRRSSATSTTDTHRSNVSSAGSDAGGPPRVSSTLRKSISLSKLAEHQAANARDRDSSERTKVTVEAGTGAGAGAGAVPERLVKSEVLQKPAGAERSQPSQHSQLSQNTTVGSASASSNGNSRSPAITRASTTTSADQDDRKLPAVCPQLTLEEPTPIYPPAAAAAVQQAEPVPDTPSPASTAVEPPTAPVPDRRQSLVDKADARVITTLLDPNAPTQPSAATDYFAGAVQPALSAAMLHRKIWVKRPNASATLVQIGEDDLVDDVRDMILRKYANSLGRSFDSPDVTLRIVPRDAGHGHERTLGPEEEMCRTLDAYFPGGQTVHEALIIDVPKRGTPKPSPRVPHYYAYHDDAQHAQTEYFPPMPVVQPSPAAVAHGVPHAAPHSIAVLTNGGQLPPLHSPGGVARSHRTRRPGVLRTHTASPTTMAGGIPSSATSVRPGRPRLDSSASQDKHSQGSSAPIPTPPVPIDTPVRTQHDTPPAVRVASPRPDRPEGKEKKRKPKKAPAEPPSLPAGLLDGSVPPINVLIVEDNIINLRVLGAFMQRLKVRWQRAMNGKEAVTKWKAGGFHLVLMDIQLPVMNGLEATKEIRRLERVNNIGVFSSGASETPNAQQNGADSELGEDDKLGDRSLFKSPVIIVALTASSLQSDRHEALAAGCNDFLTKPVNFVWLERKVKEWGCMQALIDFDGWRKWKDFSKDSDSAKDKDANKMSTSMASIAPAKKSTSAKSSAPALAANTPDTNGSSTASSSQEKDEKKAKRRSIVQAPPSVPEDESETPTPEPESA